MHSGATPQPRSTASVEQRLFGAVEPVGTTTAWFVTTDEACMEASQRQKLCVTVLGFAAKICGPSGSVGFNDTPAAAFLCSLGWAQKQYMPLTLAMRCVRLAAQPLSCHASKHVPAEDRRLHVYNEGRYAADKFSSSRLVSFIHRDSISEVLLACSRSGLCRVDGITHDTKPAVSVAGNLDFDMMFIALPETPPGVMRADVVELIARCLNEAMPQLLHLDEYSQYRPRLHPPVEPLAAKGSEATTWEADSHPCMTIILMRMLPKHA